MKLLALLLLLCPAFSQVQLVATPEPLAVSRSFGLKDTGVWVIAACNGNPGAGAAFSAERVRLAFPVLRMLDQALIAQQIATAHHHDRKYILTTVAETGAYLASMAAAGRLFGGGTKLPLWLAQGGGVLHQLATVFRAEQIDYTLLSAGLLSGPVALAPRGQTGECATRIVFAGLFRSAAPLVSTIPAGGSIP